MKNKGNSIAGMLVVTVVVTVALAILTPAVFSQEWWANCPLDPPTRTPWPEQPTLTPRPTLEAQPTLTPNPTPTCRPTATLAPNPSPIPYPTQPPFPTNTPLPTSTAYPTQPYETPTPSGAYYVATDGDDNNPGTEAQPWRTIQRGLDTMVAGNTLLIREGEYQPLGYGFRFPNSGTEENPITVSNYPGERVVIRGTYSGEQYEAEQQTCAFYEWSYPSHYIRIIGQDLPEPRPLPEPINPIILELMPWRNEDRMSVKGFVFLEHWVGVFGDGVSHWEVAGIESYGNGEFSVFAIPTTESWYIHDNVCHRNDEHGIQTNGDNNVIENNEVYYSNMHGINPYGGYGINVLGSNNIVSTNAVHDVTDFGILIEKIGSYTASDNVIEKNTIHNTAGGGVIVAGGSRNIIRNNVIYNDIDATGGNGIRVGRLWSNTDPADSEIYHNTILGNFWHSIHLADDTGVQIKNNALLTWTGNGHITGTPASDEGNLKTGVPADLFVNPTTGNFLPLSGSALIDTGAVVAVADDFVGTARPQSAGYDIGAYEYIE